MWQNSAKPYVKAFSLENLASAFQKARIHPFDTSKICKEQLAPSTIYPASSETSNNQATDAETVNLNMSPVETNKENTPVNDFLKNLKIQTVNEKPKRRKFTPPFKVLGNLESESNHIHLQIQHDNRNDKVQKAKALKKTIPTQQLKQDIRKVAAATPSPVAGPSRRPPPSPPTASDDPSLLDESSEEEDEEPCCVCGYTFPPQLRGISSLVILKWAQCDTCMKWVHLAFCTPVRVVRSNSKFVCPLCPEE